MLQSTGKIVLAVSWSVGHTGTSAHQHIHTKHNVYIEVRLQALHYLAISEPHSVAPRDEDDTD